MAQIRLIGTDPSQVPTNGMLGNLAFQNAESVNLEKLVVTSTVGINGNVTTSSGSAISYCGGETYQIWNDDPESSAVDTNGQPAAFRTLKTFVASKSGSLKFKFSAYIQSGTYYWAWRIINQASTVLSSGYYNGGLDVGQIDSVHEYRRFVASVSNVTPGDILTLQMVSASINGTPLTGDATGQILYAKEFRAYSTTPSIDHGGSSNVWGKNVGIGVHIPGSYNLPLPPITRLDVRGPNVANNAASLGSVPPATMYVGSSSGWGQNDGGSIALGGAANSSQFTATYAGIAGRRESVHGWEYGGYLTLSTVTIGTDQLSERVRITSTGTVNIVGAGIAGSTQAVSFSGSAPINSLVLNSSGQVGLGGSGNSAKITVYKTTSSPEENAGTANHQVLFVEPDGDGIAYYRRSLISHSKGLYQYSYWAIRFDALYDGDYNGSLKCRITWSTGHAAGAGFAEFSLGVRTTPAGGVFTPVHAGNLTQYGPVQFSGGWYYGWTANPDFDVYYCSGSGNHQFLVLRLSGYMGTIGNNATYDGHLQETVDLESWGYRFQGLYRLGTTAPSTFDLNAIPKTILS